MFISVSYSSLFIVSPLRSSLFLFSSSLPFHLVLCSIISFFVCLFCIFSPLLAFSLFSCSILFPYVLCSLVYPLVCVCVFLYLLSVPLFFFSSRALALCSLCLMFISVVSRFVIYPLRPTLFLFFSCSLPFHCVLRSIVHPLVLYCIFSPFL